MDDPGDPEELRRLAERVLSRSLFSPHELREASWSVGDRYRVLDVIGRGGAGLVFRVVDEEVGREAALKLLDGAAGRDSERFLQEIRLLASLDHPGIVRIFGAGLHDEAPYYVMELAPAGTLADAELSLPEWVRVLAQVCLAIGAAHARGIVHRDLKPENVLLIDGAPRVADFGVAKHLDAELSGRTQLGALVGTPLAMAPEQCGGAGEIGPWTDVHALGVMLYARLVGEPPFSDAQGLVGLLAAILDDARPDPQEQAPQAPAGLCAIAARAIARDPDARYPDATALARALLDWSRADAAAASAAPGGAPRPTTSPAWAGALAAAAGGVVLLAGLGWFVARGSTPRRAAATPSVSPPASAPPSSAPPRASAPPSSAPPPSASPAPTVAPDQGVLASLAHAPADAALWEQTRAALASSTAPAELLTALAQRLRALTWRGVGAAQPMRDAATPELDAPLTRLRQQVDALPPSPLQRVALVELVVYRAYRVADLLGYRDQAEDLVAAALRADPGPEAALAKLSWALFGLRLHHGLSDTMPRLASRADRFRAHLREGLREARARGVAPAQIADAEALVAQIEGM